MSLPAEPPLFQFLITLTPKNRTHLMLRRALALLLLVSFLFGCDKKDEVNTGLRTPTCSDTTDDGQFETFNAPETARFLNGYKSVPTGEDKSALKELFITSRKMINESQERAPRLIYTNNKPVLVWAYLPYGDNLFYSWRSSAYVASDSVSIALFNARNLNLTPGCYRVYYIFSDTGSKQVFTKGHYDFEVRRF